MRIALLHYHFRPGGVTTVVKQQVAALSGAADVLLVCGEYPQSALGAPVAVVPGLAYDGLRPDEDPLLTAEAVMAKIRDYFGGPCDLIHVHNPTLKKNAAFLRILAALRGLGARLLLQVHDLAEDGRPLSYYADEEYPADCHYAAINARDFGALRAAGLTEEGTHLLFNVVTPIDGLDETAAKTRIVYPVRAIRRKNVGEALFLSLYMPDNVELAFTLPPTSARDVPSYEAWKEIAARLRLRACFEVGLREDFAAVMSSARAVLTTSLKEGFGFSFLEPWTAGIPVAGRRLEAVCPDFEREGVSLPALYGSLRVPIEFIDGESFREAWFAAVASRAAAYGRSVSSGDLEAAYARLSADGTVDFGVLDQDRQSALLAAAAKDESVRAAVAEANPGLDGLFSPPEAALVSANRAAVRNRYSLDRYREALVAAYDAVAHRPVVQAVDKRKLLDRFLDPAEFRFFSTEAAQ